MEDPDFVDFEEQRRIDELAAYEAHLIRYYSPEGLLQDLLTEINTLLDTVPNHTQEAGTVSSAPSVSGGWTAR